MKWLKNLFREKKTMEEAKQWLAEELEKAQNSQNQATASLEQEFPDLLTAVKKSIVDLERAELHNPNIPERAKHFMQGNREQFLKLSSRFAENLIVPKEAPDFSQLDLLFQQYAQNTARPAAILSEFIGEEVKGIRKTLAEVELKIREVKMIQIMKEQLQAIQEIVQKIESIKQERTEIEQQRASFEAQLQQLKNKYDALKKEKEEFTSKPEYQKVKEDLLSAAKERQEAEQDITGIFLPLSDAIKKYAHQIKNAKLNDYAEKPLEAVIHDYSLAILKHADDIRDLISKGVLEIKPERAQKAIDSLKQLTRARLSGMIHRYANAKKREADVHHDVAERPVIKEYEQYAVDLKTTANEIQQLEATILKLKLPTDEELKEILRQELEKHKLILV